MGMWTEQEIRNLLTLFVGENKPSLLGVIKSVDKDECTCVIDDDGTETPGVRLRPVTGQNNGIVKYPKSDSFALAVKIETTEEWMLVEATEYESIIIQVGSNKVEVSDSDIIFNDGTSGLIKISELTAKLNTLVTLFNAHTHIVTTTGTATAQSGTAAAIVNQAQQFNKSDYEDTTIKH